jgi:hypothetical protein
MINRKTFKLKKYSIFAHLLITRGREPQLINYYASKN